MLVNPSFTDQRSGSLILPRLNGSLQPTIKKLDGNIVMVGNLAVTCFGSNDYNFLKKHSIEAARMLCRDVFKAENKGYFVSLGHEHGTKVVVIDHTNKPTPVEVNTNIDSSTVRLCVPEDGDAIICHPHTFPNYLFGSRTADCCACYIFCKTLSFDMSAQDWVAVVHAGWRGLKHDNQIIKAAIDALLRKIGIGLIEKKGKPTKFTEPIKLSVVIAPHISQKYLELEKHHIESIYLPEFKEEDGRFFLSLSETIMNQIGEICDTVSYYIFDRCTYKDPDLFSHRAYSQGVQGKEEGRNVSFVSPIKVVSHMGFRKNNWADYFNPFGQNNIFPGGSRLTFPDSIFRRF